ncbi:MAG TPA: AMP-binding protein [Streptosporangiaceae bacterium]|jgi:non-ribosomal peptide synthetase component F|nr:AMP-binding protein [Streptosporangiaceae bacterium]
MATAEATVGELTVTQKLLDTATARSAHVALIGGSAPASCSYPELAVLLQRAAAGLAWRGVRPRDVVGVYVADAASYILACHAIRGAGGVPTPVAAQLSIPEIAGQLADCGARMLITSTPYAAAALAAADRSWVRQVISFGEAPGATPFSSLLGLGSMHPASVRAHDLALLPYVRRADGSLGQAGVTHLDLTERLGRLGVEAGVTERDVVLAAPPAGDGRAYTELIDHALLRGSMVVAAAECDLADAARAHSGTAAIVPFGVEIEVSPPLRLLVIDG